MSLNSSGYLTSLENTVFRQLEMQARQKLYFNRPDLWAFDFLGIQLWSKQSEVALSVVSDKNVVVKAGHEVGKSFLAGVLICWWVDTRWNLPGGCFVVSTAPSTAQINAIVWREVRKFHALAAERYKEYERRVRMNEALDELANADHPLPGYITADAHWRLENGIELGYGRKPPDSKDDTMSGIHARYVLAVGDEAVGLSEALIGDLANITSNATSRRFLICNPTNPLSYVAKIYKDNTGTWSMHTISVFDSPNFHGGEGLPIEVLETMVDQSYVDDMIRDYGIKSPSYISRVTGEFAWDMGFTLIPVEDMARALDTLVVPFADGRPHLGVDVSRSEAGDMNTVYRGEFGDAWTTDDAGEPVESTDKVGMKIRLVDAWNEKNAMKTADRIHEIALAEGVHEVRIDGSGLGGPIADAVSRLSDGRYEVIEMIGGEASPNRQRYYNLRAFWYGTFADRIRDGEIDIDVNDTQLQEELQGIEIKKRPAGVNNLLIESKEDMRKRGVGSPDYADAANYTAAYSYGITEGDMAGIEPGDKIVIDPAEWLEIEVNGPGMPV